MTWLAILTSLDKYDNSIVVKWLFCMTASYDTEKSQKNKSDILCNINLNVHTRSMKGILMLFEGPDRTNTEQYYNPKIENVEMTIEGERNPLYSQGMRAYQQWDEMI